GILDGVYVLALYWVDHVRGWPSVDVAEHERGASVAVDLVQGGGEVLPRRERIDVDAVFRGRVPGVEYAHHFSGLGEAVEVAAPELGGVLGVGAHREHGIVVPVRPPVFGGVVRQIEEQSGGNEGTHVPAGVVRLDDVGGLRSGERAAQGRREVIEALGVPVDLHAVFFFERLVQPAHLFVLPAADLLIPHGQGARARGAVVAGRCFLVRARIAGTARCARGKGKSSDGGEGNRPRSSVSHGSSSGC